MKNRILVVPGNTDLNRGDQALVWESIRLFEDIYPNPEVYLYESGATQEEKNLQKAQTQSRGYNFITRILLHPRVKAQSRTHASKEVNYSKLTYIKWGFVAIFDLFNTLLLTSRVGFLNKLGRASLNEEQKKSLDIIPTLDALVVKGGGFLHSYGKLQDPYVMYFFLFDLMLAHRYNVKTVVLPNSIGPLKNGLAKYLVKRVLKRSAFVSVREEVSFNFVKEQLGIQAFKYPDLGFFLKSSSFDAILYLLGKGINTTDKNILLTLRPYRFDGFKNPDKLYHDYLTEISQLVKEQVQRGYKFTFMAHTLGPSNHENDTLALKEVLSIIDQDIRENITYIEDFSLNAQDIQKIYANYDILIGTRFHSVIFALNEKIPCVAIAYGGNKSYGIMQDMDLANFVIGIEKVNSNNMSEMILAIESERTQYIDKITKYHSFLENERMSMLTNLKIALNE
ncbi:polysaccharide pyruvyl transferase family protein [Xanthomarina sp. F1114]|uniref:polysaccharide pyruvyl transferase family protein n=1 Tax=Xanthomarina sp. F1114 TaxID=2996019 RepID=UPI00225E4C69|nr:polysaccharide pyruvyl transferase family protein [Xanthomarina sp. F1114]MCX7548866.1 polysaccharide pyruvyl transferase family protein [Xanthomarina sp. F1114]